MILNTDGSVKGSVGPAGAGGVIRNDRGEWVAGFSAYLGHCTTMAAELKALQRGLNCARQLGVNRLEVRVDSKIVVELMTGRHTEQPKYHFLVRRCKQMICDTGWEVCIIHCFRETNQIADTLAKIGTMGGLDMVVYQTPPKEIQSILYSDKMGFLWPRRRS